MQALPRTSLDLEAVESWPAELVSFMEAHHDLFLRWEIGSKPLIQASAFDRAIYRLSDAMRPYSIVGWHCTRLTHREIARIEAEGMRLPGAAMLSDRIDKAADQSFFSITIAERLKADNQAHPLNRAGMIWFCFFPPRLATESGIGDFLRFWGGEALYRSHQRHPETAGILRDVGTPSIVDADSDDAAHRFLHDAARRSDLMPPTLGRSVGG
jgi:hypothetical protein